MHRPVMLQEVLAWLQPRAGGIYLDGTIGAGGHSLAILEASGPDGRIVGLDRDATAVATSRQALLPYGDRAVIVQAAYGDALHVVRETTERSLDGALLDLGVSSQQLDTPARGFSFLANGPLDMRMDVRDSVTAADLVNRLPEKDLIQTLEKHGEERYARYLHGRLHCATRTFQALRIAVNHELESLEPALRQIAALLRPGGRLVVLAFHSLEDRIVKQTFRALAQGPAARFAVLTKRPLTPSARECAENPRARSGKLRVLAAREAAL